MFNIKLAMDKKRIGTRRLVVKKEDVTLVVNVLSDIGTPSGYDIRKREDDMYYITFESRNDVWRRFIEAIDRAFMLVLVDYTEYFELV